MKPLAGWQLNAKRRKAATHDVGDDAAAGDGGLDEGVQLLVTADGQLQVARCDTLHLQVLGGVASQLQHLQGESRAVVGGGKASEVSGRGVGAGWLGSASGACPSAPSGTPSSVQAAHAAAAVLMASCRTGQASQLN